MMKKILLSFISVAVCFGFIGAANAFTIKNKTDRSFFMQSANIPQIWCGAHVIANKKKYSVSHCDCAQLSLCAKGYCQGHRLCVGPNDKVVITGKKGKYKAIESLTTVQAAELRMLIARIDGAHDHIVTRF